MFQEWAERRRRAAAERESARLAAVEAEVEATLARDRAVETSALRSVNDVVEQYIQKLPPLGSSVEAGVDQLLRATNLAPGMADLHRPTFVALAIKFARPDERLVGVYVKTRFSANGARRSYPAITVGFTHGFGVKCGSRTFRADLKSANPDHLASMHKYLHQSSFRISASVRFGEEVCIEAYEFQGVLSNLYLMIAAQERLIRESQREASHRTAGSARSRKGKRPRRVLIRTWRDAELVAAEWMKYWGFTDVVATAVGADGGIDVFSNEAIAQVKAEMSATGRPKVQQHHGVAVSEGKTAIFFAMAGFTPGAKTYAEVNGILLFTFDLQGEPEPVNTAAHTFMATRS